MVSSVTSLSFSSPDLFQVPLPQQTPGVNSFHSCLQGDKIILHRGDQNHRHSLTLILYGSLPDHHCVYTHSRQNKTEAWDSMRKRSVAQRLPSLLKKTRQSLSYRALKRRQTGAKEIQKVKLSLCSIQSVSNICQEESMAP